MFTRTEDALNAFCPHVPNGQPITHFSQVLNHFDSATIGSGNPNQQHAIQASQHCELTLALHFLNAPGAHSGGEIKIGCSKASCYWCHIYLLELNKHLSAREPAAKVVTYASTGKRTKGWLMPGGFEEVKAVILQQVGVEVEDVFNAVAGIPRRRSDSRSPSSHLFGEHHRSEVTPSIFGPMF